MSDISLSESTEISDPKVRAIAKRVLHGFILASEKAVASTAEPAVYKLAAGAQRPEQIFLSRFLSLQPAQRQAATARVMQLVKAPEATRAQYFADLAKVDLTQAKPVDELALALPLPPAMKFTRAHLEGLRLHRELARPAGLVPQQVTDKLELRIHKVRCVDETNPEWLGDDEIAMGGTSVDETGDSKKIAEFMVRNDFDDGEQKVYSPPKQFTMFSLREGGESWPKSYFVTLVLAEKDMGGLADFLNKLLDAVKSHVVSALGAAIGGVIGSVGGPLAAVIGAAVGWIVGQIFEWLRSWWSDDVFPPKTVSVSIGSLSARFAGGATDSSNRVLRFSAHGGTYDVTYDWRVYA